MHLSGETYASQAAGLDIHRQVFHPDTHTPKGCVILLHGLGDHLGCHLRAAELFCDRGYLCVGIDWPGHGRSEGKRGHINGLSTAFDLLDETLGWLNAQPDLAGLPRAVYAHSTGAFAFLHYLRHRQVKQNRADESPHFDWVWLSSPLLRPDHEQPRPLVWAAPWLAKLAPEFILDTKVRPERTRHVRRDDSPAASRDMDGCHHWVSAAFGADLVKHGRETNETAHCLTRPTRVLLTQGADDTICPPEFSRQVFDHIATANKTYALLPGMRHEILREPSNEAAIGQIEDWLDGTTSGQ